MNVPNILFIVLDACRYDYAQKHASFLKKLGKSNLWFENAIAPSPWSLPSHASFFTGELPHEHGMYRFGDSIDTPLVSELSGRGYTTYGVSANGFASQRTGFHEDFEEFRYTGGRDLYLEGMDVSGAAQNIIRETGGSYKNALLEILSAIPGHDHRLKSLANLLAVGTGELATKSEVLQRIPHPVFAPTSDYSYDPSKNTRAIQSILKSHGGERPFFIFTNYMDTHRCYKPAAELQQNHVGRVLEYGEFVRLNEEVAAPWSFEEKKASSELDDTDIRNLRGLYAGEVETVDSHLQRLHETLKTENLLEETLVVVTADHGENLGKTDAMGRRRMGHEASVSDAVLHVPLVVANPDLNSRNISETVGLVNLYDLFTKPDEMLESKGRQLPGLVGDMPPVSQYPPKGGEDETINSYPHASRETIRHAASESSAIVYDDGWKFVAESTGERWAGRDGSEQEVSNAPESLVEATELYLSKLRETEEQTHLSKHEVDQLDALGYL